MAAALKRDLHIDVELVEGHYGEFTVLAGNDELIRGGPLGMVGVLPSVRKIRELVKQTLRTSQKSQPLQP